MLGTLHKVLVAVLLVLTLGPAIAHKASDSYYRLDIQGATVTGQLDVALRDLEFALGLDADGDGEITWGELRQQRAAIVDWALPRLSVRRGGPCTLQAGALMVDTHTDGAYAVLPLSGQCPAAAGEVNLDYGLLFDQDALHRGLLRLNLDGATQTAVFSPERPQQRFEAEDVSRWTQFRQYLVEGVWHIWLGFDHVLFLLALLLPSVLQWDGQRWKAVGSLGSAGREVLAVVTAFTLAHSVTLSLATLGWVSLPSRLVESLIALSVVLAAANNLRPMVKERRWLVAFCFGLIHGFGFASVLAELGLPQQALVLSLVGFNVGVEIGQIAIVAVFLPLAFLMRETPAYREGIFKAGSWGTLVVAAVWLCERALNLQLISAV